MNFSFKYICLFLLFLPSFTYAQSFNKTQIKTAFILKFINNIEWPNIDDFDEFKIAIYGQDTSIRNSFMLLAQSKNIKNLPIKIIYSDNFSSISLSNPQVIYIAPNKNYQIKEIFYATLTLPILLISDNVQKKTYIMLNFKYNDNNISFELNKINITNQNLKILPKLLFLGGTELSYKNMYDIKQKELLKEKEIVKNQQNKLKEQSKMLDNQMDSINYLNLQIEMKKSKIDSLAYHVALQQKYLQEKNKLLNNLKINIVAQKIILDKKTKQLQTKKDSILVQKNIILTQKKQINQKLSKLNSLNSEYLKRETDIKNQKKQLISLQNTISLQKLFMILLVVTLVLIILFIIFSIKNFNKNKSLNKKLVIKNNEIIAQSEEVKQKNDLLTKQKNQIQIQNDVIKESILYAKKIQQAMQPDLSIFSEIFNHFLIFKPKDFVSGDFYWVQKVFNKKTKKNHFFIAVADCTGHGVPGALLSSIGNRLLSEITKYGKIKSPAKILKALNKNFQKVLRQKEVQSLDGMDIVLIKIEQISDSFNITYAGAKIPLFIFSNNNNKLIKIESTRKTIGGIFQNKDIEFLNNKYIAQKNDILYLTTDGYIDQNNPERRRFGTQKFSNLLSKIGKLQLEEQKNILLKELKDWKKDEPQRDDITIFALKLIC